MSAMGYKIFFHLELLIFFYLTYLHSSSIALFIISILTCTNIRLSFFMVKLQVDMKTFLGAILFFYY